MATSTHGSRPTALKHNEAAGAPGVNDDSSAGYGIHSKWVDTTADVAYTCVDSTVGAAVWFSGSGGGGGLTQAQVLARTMGS